MKLTDIVLRLSNHLKFHHIPGNILNGKHRVWPKLTPRYKRVLLKKIDNEVNNMKLISRPFLTQEESKLAFDKLEQEKEQKENMQRLEKIRSNKNKLEDKLMNDHFDILRYHKVWE